MQSFILHNVFVHCRDSAEDTSHYLQTVERWSNETLAKVHSLYCSEANSEIQFIMVTGYHLHTKETPDPWWKDCVYGFRHVDPASREASLINIPAECKQIWCHSTFSIDTTLYLQWMQKRFQSNGGKIEKRKIKSLEELSLGYSIVINCTGVWASQLVPEETMQPTRGQAVIVRAPWITHFVVDHRDNEYLTYIIPRANSVAIGGTLEHGSWSEDIKDDVTEDILKRCTKLEPSLARAEVIDVWAGLRPVRSQVRLDTSVGPKGGLVIHCYGHGGQGISLSWGCAKDIGDIVQRQIKNN